MKRENYFFFCIIGNETFLPKYIENKNSDFITLYGTIEKGRLISFEIPIKNYLLSQYIYFYLSYLGLNIEIFPLFGEFSHLTNINNSYYICNEYILKILNKRLIIFEYDIKLKINFEKQYSSELEKFKKQDVIKLRQYMKYRNKIKKNLNYKIWIINDRYDKAGDNGEYFFRYLKFKKPIGIKIYFAIDKNCSDYKRLQILESIIDFNSKKYKNIFLEADKLITSVYNNFIYNPFMKYDSYVRDLFDFDLIFLPNIYINDDKITNIINFDQLYNILIKYTFSGYKYIFNFQNSFNINNAFLKEDLKNDNPIKYSYNNNFLEKIIVIIPKFIEMVKPLKITHNKTKNYSRRLGLKFYKNLIIFCINENYEQKWNYFNVNDKFSIVEKCDYHNILLKASLLITDYSNIYYYFLFLKKPVIFLNIDNEEYTRENYQEKYLNYKIEGLDLYAKILNAQLMK